MNFNDLNEILHRQSYVNDMKKILMKNDNTTLNKKYIYLYGNAGIGKTQFAMQILKECEYDYILYDAGNIRNKIAIDNMTKCNGNQKNIMSLFNKKSQKIAIIMDELDNMNNGDKGGINALIKLIKHKKNNIATNTIIFIANNKNDKKTKDLMKGCDVFELKEPTIEQTFYILKQCLLSSKTIQMNVEEITEKLENMKSEIVSYIQGDLRKINFIYELFHKKNIFFTKELFSSFFQYKSYNNNTKKITSQLFNHYYSINEHDFIMNETDRTSVGLLWHENIIDTIQKIDKDSAINFYIRQLDNICYADYIDRVTFQKQIWQFNEMSSLIKTMKNNHDYFEFLGQCHSNFSESNPNFYIENDVNSKKKKRDKEENIQQQQQQLNEIRFTKVLTKYSTEYNNFLFIQKLCQKLGMDKKDLFGFFNELSFEDPEIKNQKISILSENYDIKKIDIQRLYRYMSKYTDVNAPISSDATTFSADDEFDIGDIENEFDSQIDTEKDDYNDENMEDSYDEF